MKTIETTVELGDDQMLHIDLRTEPALEKGTYHAVIVLERATPNPPADAPKPTDAQTSPPIRFRRAGTAKGKIWIADDFDETPEDFKDYL